MTKSVRRLKDSETHVHRMRIKSAIPGGRTHVVARNRRTGKWECNAPHGPWTTSDASSPWGCPKNCKIVESVRDVIDEIEAKEKAIEKSCTIHWAMPADKSGSPFGLSDLLRLLSEIKKHKNAKATQASNSHGNKFLVLYSGDAKGIKLSLDKNYY
jgi:hypothetical protein